MSSWAEGVITAMGYWGVVALMLLENLFPPIPSELIMPFAGFAAARGELALAGVIAAGAAGSVLGAVVLYALGRWLGLERLERFADRHGHWLMSTRGDLERAKAFFDRHGSKTVFFARLIPGLRSLISIPAGMCRMRWSTFLLWTLAGTTVWSGLLAWLGAQLGERYTTVDTVLGPATYVVVGGLAIAYMSTVIRRLLVRRTERVSAPEHSD